MTDELKIRIQALLNRALSKQNIIKDITYLERTPFYLKLIAKLNRSKAKTSIQQDLQSISANQSVTVKARVDRNSVLNSLRDAQQAARTEAQNNPIDIPAHFDVDTNGLNRVNQAQNEIIENSGGIKDIVQSYINWNKAIDLIIQTMRKAVDTSKELAEAQTNLQIVTGNNHQQMISLMRDYNQLARELSATTVDVTSAADGWLRTGKSIAETEELIADSTILSKIGKIESAEAQKYLTSAMNGFKVEAKDVIGIVDKLSATDLVSATSAGGLAEAMSKCANSADIAGVSMDNLIGYIATVSETTQKSDSVVGESFKTLFARMGKIKLGDFIDDDGNDISGEINDVEKVLGKFDIKLRDTADEFRNFQDVIYDVGTAWDKFSSVEKNAIANAFGGVYQRENVLTLFENFSRALELAEVSANSSGKALEKYAIYEQGLEAATNRLTAAFESLSYNAIDSDFIASLADGAAGIVEFVDKTKLLQTGLTALTFAGTIKGLLLLGTKLIATKNNVVNMTAAINLSTKAGALNAEENAMLGNSYSALTAKQQKLILSNKKLSTEQRITILQTQGLTRAEAEQKLQTMGLMTAQQGAATATFSLRGAWEALKLSIASNPLGLIITALTTATMLISQAIEKQKEQEQAIIDSAKAAREESDAIIELYSEFRKISKEYEVDTSKKSELIKVTDTLLEKLGYEKSTIAELIDEYGSLDNALKTITLQSLGEAENKFIAAKDLKEKELIGTNLFTGRNMWIGATIQKDYKELDDKIAELLDNSGLFTSIVNDRDGVVNMMFKNDGNNVDGVIKNYEDISKALELLKEEYYTEELGHSSIFKALTSEQEILKNNIDNYNSAIADLNNNVAQQQVITALLGKELPKTQKEFDDFRQTMIESARESETWSKKFVGGADKAEKAVDDVLQSMPEFADFFAVEVPQSTDKSVIALGKVAKSIDELSDKLNSFMSAADTFSNALKKIITNSSLTFDELQKLLSLDPNLIYDVTKNDDGTYNIGKDSLINSASNFGAENNPYKEDYEKSQEEVNKLEQQLASLENKNNDPRIKNTGLTQQIADIKNELEIAKKELAANKLLFEGYNDTIQTSIDTTYLDKINNSFSDITKEVKDKVGDYNTAITSLQKAIDEISSGKALTYDTITELVKSFPALNDKIREGADGFYIEANALAAVLETSYKARNEFIDNEKIKTDNAIQQAQQRIQVWQIELNILEKFGDADSERAKSLKKYIDEAKQSIEDNKSILAWLDSLTGNIFTGSTAGNNTDSVSKELQNEINYYNMLIKAVETLADKEIEALEKEKDALKEKNDEQQRELDLLEAKNNLEKAKKQKVFVYKEGQGLVQVQDEKAVRDAQKEYDDIQNEIKIDEIDKQIDKWEEYKKQFSEMENGIKDTLTVEQAKQALGTDEQGLLSLDDKTIAGIRDGMAEATYKKDAEDNKDNPKYQVVSFDDFLKSIGAKVNGEQFMKLADNMFSDYRNIVPANNTNNSTTNNSSISNIINNNNNAVSLNPMFNIYDATDPQKVANSVEKYLHILLTQTLNSVK